MCLKRTLTTLNTSLISRNMWMKNPLWCPRKLFIIFSHLPKGWLDRHATQIMMQEEEWKTQELTQKKKIVLWKMLTTTCLIWPLLEVGRTVTRSPSRPSTRLHTTRFGFTGERAMTTSPGLTFSNLDDRCSNSNMSPETLNVGSMLGPKHWHIVQTRTVRETSWFLQTSVCLFLCSFYINSLKAQMATHPLFYWWQPKYWGFACQ